MTPDEALSDLEVDRLIDELCDLAPDGREDWFTRHTLGVGDRERIERLLGHFDAAMQAVRARGTGRGASPASTPAGEGGAGA